MNPGRSCGVPQQNLENAVWKTRFAVRGAGLANNAHVDAIDSGQSVGQRHDISLGLEYCVIGKVRGIALKPQLPIACSLVESTIQPSDWGIVGALAFCHG